MTTPPTPAVAAPRSTALDALRSSLTLLVVAHHAVLAYFLYAPPLGAFDGTLIWGAFPIIDPAKSPGVDALVLWNDSFFMALMFLLSGLFVGPSLARRGAGGFLAERLLRLGLPFVVGAAVLAPLAYYPAYLQRAELTSAPGFWAAWQGLDRWVAGPAWFLWVLLAFSILTAGLHAGAPRVLAALGQLGEWCRVRPGRLVLVWSALALVGYLSVVVFVHPMLWSGWGPFSVQTSRVLLYAVYFFLGVALGWRGELPDYLRLPEGALARRWVAWQIGAGAAFVGFVALVIVIAIQAGKGISSPTWNIAGSAAMALSGVLTSVGLLAAAVRRRSIESPGWASLRRNAFGIYLVHYAIVTWLQFALLSAALPGWAKAAVATAGGIGLSWAIAAGLRRLPGLRRIL